MLALPRRPARADTAREGHERLDRPPPRAPAGGARQLHAAAVPEPRQSRGPMSGPRPREILSRPTAGKLDFFVAGVGTGGTITGVGPGAEAAPARPQGRAVEPEASPVLSGGQHSPHPIQASVRAFIPDILDRKVIDEIEKVSNQAAITTARDMAASKAFPSASRRAAISGRRWRSASAIAARGSSSSSRLRRALSLDAVVRGFD